MRDTTTSASRGDRIAPMSHHKLCSSKFNRCTPPGAGTNVCCAVARLCVFSRSHHPRSGARGTFTRAPGTYALRVPTVCVTKTSGCQQSNGMGRVRTFLRNANSSPDNGNAFPWRTAHSRVRCAACSNARCHVSRSPSPSASATGRPQVASTAGSANGAMSAAIPPRSGMTWSLIATMIGARALGSAAFRAAERPRFLSTTCSICIDELLCSAAIRPARRAGHTMSICTGLGRSSDRSAEYSRAREGPPRRLVTMTVTAGRDRSGGRLGTIDADRHSSRTAGWHT